MNPTEIAESLGISVEEVQATLRSASEKLRHTPTRLYYAAKWRYQQQVANGR